jgi:hypothetical protein
MKESGVNSGGKGSPVRRTGDSQEYQACNRYFLINVHKTKYIRYYISGLSAVHTIRFK